MEKILALNDLLKNAFASIKNFIIFPFAIIALIVSAVYYVFSPIFMLFDFTLLKLKQELYENERITNGAQIVKFIVSYPFTFIMTILHIVLQWILAIGYFTISLFFFISSLGKVGKNLFLFHKI